MRLHTCAAYLRKYCKIDPICKPTTAGTTIYTSCGKCRKTLVLTPNSAGSRAYGTFSFCVTCRVSVVNCSIWFVLFLFLFCLGAFLTSILLLAVFQCTPYCSNAPSAIMEATRRATDNTISNNRWSTFCHLPKLFATPGAGFRTLWSQGLVQVKTLTHRPHQALNKNNTIQLLRAILVLLDVVISVGRPIDIGIRHRRKEIWYYLDNLNLFIFLFLFLYTLYILLITRI